MAYGDELRELMEGARDALHDLLTEVRPHDAIRLREGYGDLCQWLECDDQLRGREIPIPNVGNDDCDESPAPENTPADNYRRRMLWRNLPTPEKLHLILNAIGDDRLTGNELRARMTERYPEWMIGHLEGLVAELVRRGEFDRAKERIVPGGSRWQWRYHRRAALSREMEALEHALSDQDEAVA